MPRIRTIKPEFWDSPSTASASPWARLLFIAMWNWADDYGRGTANVKELEGFAFPHDDEFTDRSGNTVHFRSLVAEVSECFGVVFYEVDGRPYYAIPSWEEHQRNERRAKQSKFPDPPLSPQVNPASGDHERSMHGISATQERNVRTSPALEQGNRGTEEQGNSQLANARPDVDELCAHLADRIESNGSKRPTITKAWRDAARLMLDRDERPHDEAMRLIDWSQSSDFWQSNILSMTKFRQKYDTLRLQANRAPTTGPNGVPLDRGAQIILAERQQRLQREAQQQQEGEQPWLIER